MAKWRGRRGRRGAAPPDSDSVGRTGAALPQQEVEPLRPSYPQPQPPPTTRQSPRQSPPQSQPQPPRAQQQQQAPSGQPGQKRGSRRRRRRGRGGAQTPPSVAAANTGTLAECLPEAVEAEPFSEALPAPAAPTFAPEFRAEASETAKTSQPARGVVVLAIGLPGSGKSTWFKRRGVTPLSSDLLRTVLFDDITEQRYQHLVFSTLRSILRARLIARMPWNYVDATNLSPKERRHWIQMAREFGYEVHAVFFDVPLEVCLDRNLRRQRIVPDDIMREMAAKLRPPKFEEGFAKITVVRVKPAAQQ